MVNKFPLFPLTCTCLGSRAQGSHTSGTLRKEFTKHSSSCHLVRFAQCNKAFRALGSLCKCMIAHLDHAGLSAVPASAAAVDNERVRRVGPRRGQGLAELLQSRSGGPLGCCVAGLFNAFSLNVSKEIIDLNILKFLQTGMLCFWHISSFFSQ